MVWDANVWCLRLVMRELQYSQPSIYCLYVGVGGLWEGFSGAPTENHVVWGYCQDRVSIYGVQGIAVGWEPSLEECQQSEERNQAETEQKRQIDARYELKQVSISPVIPDSYSSHVQAAACHDTLWQTQW